MDGWKKVEMNPTWDYENEKELVGTYKSKEEGVGPNNSVLYNFERPDGTSIGVWGNTLLDNKLKNVKVGDEVKLVYLGMARSEKSGRQYHNFEVYQREKSFSKVPEKPVQEEPQQTKLPF